MLRATRALRAVDLVAAAQRLGPAARGELAALRKTHEDLKRQLENTPKEADPIDWEHYSKVIRTPGVVDLFKTAHAGLKFPSIDTRASLSAIDEGEKAMVKLAEEASKEAEVHLANLQKQLQALETAKSVDDVTTEEILKANPGWEREINKEFSENKWL